MQPKISPIILNITSARSTSERRHFFVRDLVEDGQLVVPLISTVDNLADFFTKALPPATFFRMRNAIMNVDTSRDVKSAFADGGVGERLGPYCYGQSTRRCRGTWG